MKKLSATMVALLLITLTAKASRVGVYCHMSTTGTEIFEDNNIRARIALAQDGAALLEVTNKTDKIQITDMFMEKELRQHILKEEPFMLFMAVAIPEEISV